MATYLGATATFDHACQCAAVHHRWDRDESMGDLPDTTDRNYYVSVNKVHDCYPFFRAASMADVLATFSYWPLGYLYPVCATNLAPTAKS